MIANLQRVIKIFTGEKHASLLWQHFIGFGLASIFSFFFGEKKLYSAEQKLIWKECFRCCRHRCSRRLFWVTRTLARRLLVEVTFSRMTIIPSGKNVRWIAILTKPDVNYKNACRYTFSGTTTLSLTTLGITKLSISTLIITLKQTQHSE